MATQTKCAMQQLSLPHTVQRIHLPASVLLVVGPSVFPASQQSPVLVPGAPEKKLLLPLTTRKIISSPKKRTGNVSVAEDTSLPKRKRGRPRRDSSAAVASRSLAPRPILPRVAGGVTAIALAGQRLQELPYSAARNCSTTLIGISNNQSNSNSCHASTSRKSFISLSSLQNMRHINNGSKQFNCSEVRQSDCFSSPPQESDSNTLRDKSSMKPNNPGNGFVKMTATLVDDSYRSATPNLNLDDKSKSCFGVANLKMAEIDKDVIPHVAICKIDSKQTLPVSTNHNIADRNRYDGSMETERPKPLVIRSSSSLQSPHKVDSGSTFSIIRISTRSQSPASVISETTSLTNDSSIVGHCMTDSSSGTTKSLPLIPDHSNYCHHTGKAITSLGSVLEGHNLHTKKSLLNTIHTFSSFGIEHDEPLDPSIVQRLNERLNTGSTHLASPCEGDSERPVFGKNAPQKPVGCSETNQFKLNESEETRDHDVPTTDDKGAKKTFLCQVCGKLLNGCSNLKSHLLTHSSARPHICHVCSKAFRRRHTFHIHLRTHTNDNPYTCGRCPAAFKTRSNLVRHEVVHTTRSRDYCCQECGKEFTSKLSLNAHRKVHAAAVTGPCVCSQCGEVYATMQSLRTHQLHHKYPDKQFKCKLCDKAYVFQSLLKRHMDGHNGVQKFHCHLCSVTFAWKSSLAAHILTHYPKKFKCKLCNLSFNTEKRLASHLKKHSEPNPHSCTLCLKKYPFRYLLVRHVKSAHGHRSFVTVKAKAVPRKADMLRRIKNPTSGVSKEANPGIVSQKMALKTSETSVEPYPGSNSDTLGAINNSHKSTKQPPFFAVNQKVPMHKFRCVSALREHVPRFTVSIGQKSECPVVMHSNSAKQEQGTKYEPAVVCYPALETVCVAESDIVSSPADVCNDGGGSCEKQPPPSRSSSSYREPPPSYYSASPQGMESFVEGSGDSPTSFRHSSTAKSKLQSEHEPRSVSSGAQDSYTPSYETFSSCITFNELQSPPGLGRYQRCGGPPHPNLLPASSDPYLQAASSAHSACFPSPPQHPAFDSPSSRHQSGCDSSHQASYNLPPHLQPSYGSSSPSQQSHGGVMYLATHSDYDLAGCLDEALPDGE